MTEANPAYRHRQSSRCAIGDISTVATRVSDKSIAVGALIAGIDIYRSQAIRDHLQANPSIEQVTLRAIVALRSVVG